MEHEFGRLSKVDLRQGWPSEAGDFTPWLADPANLELLGDAIGVDLVPLHTEHPVGPYRADLVCEDSDSDTGQLVLIENQLAKTDHRHLGQLLTYAAGLQAKTVVWIARRFTEEHQAALDWLNDHSDDAIRLFGLEIELWRIGDSALAPKFNIVAKPNEWVKAGASIRTSGASERKRLQLGYWSEFSDWIAEDSSDEEINLSSPKGMHWMNESTYHTSDMRNALTIVTTRSEVGVELYLERASAKARFAYLESHKEAIEAQFGGPLDWQPLPDRIACRIKATLTDADWTDPTDRMRQFGWMKDTLLRLKSAIDPYVPALRGLVEESDEVTQKTS